MRHDDPPELAITPWQDLIARDAAIHENLKAEARTISDIVLTEVSTACL